MPVSSLYAPKFHNQITHPTASAFMVHADPTQANLMWQAVQDFDRQTWPYKEMILINATEQPLTSLNPLVRIIQVKARYLGELKNLGMYNATGEWCFPWHADCQYQPGYMDWHMIRRSRSSPVVIKNPFGRVLPSGVTESVDPHDATFCSFHRFSTHGYDESGDDLKFISGWPNAYYIDSEALIAVRLFREHTD